MAASGSVCTDIAAKAPMNYGVYGIIRAMCVSAPISRPALIIAAEGSIRHEEVTSPTTSSGCIVLFIWRTQWQLLF